MRILNKILTVLLLLVLLIISVVLVNFGYTKKQEETYDSINIQFDDNNEFEYGSNVSSKDLIVSVVGEIINEYPEINTFEIGKQTLDFDVEYKGQTKSIQHTIEIVDTQFPEITLKKKSIKLKNGEKYNPKDNVDSVFDPVDGDITNFEAKHSLDINEAGEYIVEIIAKDSNGNKTSAEFTIIVEEKEVLVVENEDVKPTYINSILLVNKTYHLPSNFGGENSTATQALAELQVAAKEEGYDLPLLSGYRSYNYQKQLFQSYANKYGVDTANTFSAKAGQSEHQTGLAFDVGQISDDYGNTDAGKWLHDNCAQYGFIIRYLKGKEHITGYKYEPWHIRYVGVEHATTIMSQGITLEEYLGAY